MQESHFGTIYRPNIFTMKFMILILILAVVITEAILQRKILRTAVFYDPQVTQLMDVSSGQNDSARDHVLFLVQKTNNLLNQADMHIQLMMKVTEWPFVAINGSIEQYWEDVRKQMNSILPESMPGLQEYGKLTEFVLILAGHHVMVTNPVSFRKDYSKPCGNPLPFVARISMSDADYVLRTDDQLVASMASGLLIAIGTKWNCIEKPVLPILPNCIVKFLRGHEDSYFSCLTESPVCIDFADPICNNSIRETGELCDCASYDVACRKDCVMSSCRNNTSNGPPIDDQRRCIHPKKTVDTNQTDVGSQDPKAKKGSSTLFIGIAVICLLLAVVLIAALYYYLRRKGKRVPALLPVEKENSLRVNSQRSEIRATSVPVTVRSPSVYQPRPLIKRALK